MPSGIVSIVVTVLSSVAVGRSSNRWLWIAGLAIPGALGGALMSFLPSTNKAGLLAGIYLVNSIVAVLVLVFNWVSSNVAGHTKRSIATALIAGAFSIGSIIGPQTFQAKDAPNYYPAKIAVLATQAGAALFAIILRFYYGWQNSLREQRSQDIRNSGNKEDSISEESKWGNCKFPFSLSRNFSQTKTNNQFHSNRQTEHPISLRLLVFFFLFSAFVLRVRNTMQLNRFAGATKLDAYGFGVNRE